MVNLETRRFLSIGLVVLVFTTAMAWGAPALADSHCHKNHDKNCNDSEKNQNSSPKLNCIVYIDDLNNIDFGLIEQQCLNNIKESNNIKDSTVTQNPPPDGSGNTSNPTISINPTSGPVGTSVNITGAGFDPSSTITIEFDGTSVATSPSTVTSTSAGFFIATFIVPPFSNGDHTVKATQGGNSDSETFTVTPSSNTTTASSPNLSEKMILLDMFG